MSSHFEHVCVAVIFWVIVGIVGCCCLLLVAGLVGFCLSRDSEEKVEDYSMRDATELDYFDDEYI
jgi:hypothetical protein